MSAGHRSLTRRDVHDAPAIIHQRKQLLRKEVHAFEVDVNYLIELRLGHLFEVHVERIAGVVHKLVKPIALPSLEGFADIGHEPIE